MKIRRFSIRRLSSLFLALTVSCSAFTTNAETLQWGESGKTTTIVNSGSDLRWSTPKVKGVIVTAHHVSSNDSSAIVQVQHRQPAITPPQAPAPMSNAQRDLVFPELRPQSITPPSGATSIPSTPSSSTTLPKQDSPASTSSSSSTPSAPASLPKRDSYVPQKDAVDAVIEAVVKSDDLPKPESSAVEKKDPSLESNTSSTRLKNVPKAPAPVDPYSAASISARNKEIQCPNNADSKSIREISYDIRPMPGPLPKECPLRATTYNGRHFSQTCYQWKASALCTKGAYFEDVQLERYGHSICPTLQPVISGAKFFLTVPFLPYKMGLIPPNECVYTLGHYRVGNCAPYMLDPLPISVRAMLFEGAAIGAGVALIP